MIPASVKTAIFVSLPKTVTGYTCFVEYASIAEVTAKLKTKDIVVTIGFFGGAKSSSSPTNGFLGKVYSSVLHDIVYTKGEIQTGTLSIDITAKELPNSSRKAETVVDAYLSLLEGWYLKEARSLIQIIGKSDITDLSALEEGSQRKHIDIYFEYAVGYEETVDSIETVEFPVTLTQ